jgi:hypothetical protein
VPVGFDEAKASSAESALRLTLFSPAAIGCGHMSFSKLASLKPDFASWCPAMMLARSKYGGLSSTSGSLLQSPAGGSHGSKRIPSAI